MCGAGERALEKERELDREVEMEMGYDHTI